jgi:hypothetical protein
MASSFETAFAAQFNPAAVAQFAETITYTPSGGSPAPSSVSAVVLRESRQQARDGALVLEYEMMEIYVLASQVVTPKDQFQALAPDSVTIDTETWFVGEVLQKNAAGWHRLLLKSKDFR